MWRRKNISSVNLKTRCFDDIDSAVIIFNKICCYGTSKISFVLPCSHCWWWQLVETSSFNNFCDFIFLPSAIFVPYLRDSELQIDIFQILQLFRSSGWFQGKQQSRLDAISPRAWRRNGLQLLDCSKNLQWVCKFLVFDKIKSNFNNQSSFKCQNTPSKERNFVLGGCQNVPPVISNVKS